MKTIIIWYCNERMLTNKMIYCLDWIMVDEWMDRLIDGE